MSKRLKHSLVNYVYQNFFLVKFISVKTFIGEATLKNVSNVFHINFD